MGLLKIFGEMLFRVECLSKVMEAQKLLESSPDDQGKIGDLAGKIESNVQESLERIDPKSQEGLKVILWQFQALCACRQSSGDLARAEEAANRGLEIAGKRMPSDPGREILLGQASLAHMAAYAMAAARAPGGAAGAEESGRDAKAEAALREAIGTALGNGSEKLAAACWGTLALLEFSKAGHSMSEAAAGHLERAILLGGEEQFAKERAEGYSRALQERLPEAWVQAIGEAEGRFRAKRSPGKPRPS